MGRMDTWGQLLILLVLRRGNLHGKGILHGRGKAARKNATHASVDIIS